MSQARAAICVFWAENETPWPAERERAAIAHLPPHVAARAVAYRHWQDRQARIIARLLLMAALDDAGLPGSLERLSWDAHGRPGLPVPGAFSIAHSGGRVLCAWADRGSVGVDVERLRAVDPTDFEDLLSPGERARITGAANPSQAFLEIWTIKEAVAKAAGLGLMGGALADTAGPGPLRFAERDWHAARRVADGYAFALAADLADPADADWISMRIQSDARFSPSSS